jgi:hypothetical protein
MIGDQKVQYGRTKPIYGIPFDQQSKDSFINKKALTQGFYKEIEGEKIYIINAILEKGLLSVNGPKNYPAPKGFKKNPKKFVLKQMPKNRYSQGKKPWSGILYQEKSYQPKPGESVLIVTLSGRQGDTPGAAGGHNVFGSGVVKNDLTIEGDTSNFYFEGPKEVLAGNTDLVSYFGHIIQGQQNYRPTYTIYVYGVDKEDIQRARNLYEMELHKVRTVKGLKITPGYNCTTTTNKYLEKVGFYGVHQSPISRITDLQNLFYLNPLSWWADAANGNSIFDKLKVISFVLSRDTEYYIPRPSFESFIKNFTSKRYAKQKGIKRVDYVFIPQTPSRRPVGGMSYNDPIWEAKKMISANEERKKRMPEINKAHHILLNPGNFSEDEIKKARELIRKDQAEVKALLDTIN